MNTQEALLELLNNRSSCRTFKSEPISRANLETIVQLTNNAPSSCNLQTHQIIIIDDPRILTQLSREVSYKFSYSKSFFLICMQKNLSVKRGANYVSIGILVDQLVLVASAMGFATLMMAGFEGDKEIRSLLKIPDNFEVVLLIAVGLPQVHSNFKVVKTPIETKLGINSFNGAGELMSDSNAENWPIDHLINYRSRISQVYLDRYRLNSVNDYIYNNLVLANVLKVIDSFQSSVNLLDLITYDGKFCKLLSERSQTTSTKVHIHVSDLDTRIVDFHVKALGVKGFTLEQISQEENQPEFDIVTCIFQFNHFSSSQVASLLNIAYRSAKKNGVFFIAIFADSFLKKFARFLRRRLIRIIKSEALFNVYENSIWYKAGPYREISNREIKKGLLTAGFLSVTYERLYSRKNFLSSRVTLFIAHK